MTYVQIDRPASIGNKRDAPVFTGGKMGRTHARTAAERIIDRSRGDNRASRRCKQGPDTASASESNAGPANDNYSFRTEMSLRSDGFSAAELVIGAVQTRSNGEEID